MDPGGRHLPHGLLSPESPEDRITLYRLIRESLVAEIVGRPEVVGQLALIGARHLSGNGGRVLVRGEAGTGKTKLIRTLARVTALPLVEIDAASLSETGWKGFDIPHHIERLHSDLMRKHETNVAKRIAARAIILVDNLDLLRLPERYASSATRDFQEGRQRSLLPLAGDGVVPLSRYAAKGAHWRSSRALVVAAGRFSQLHGAAVLDAGHLASWGFIPALADRLASFTTVSLEKLSFTGISEALKRESRTLASSFKDFGVYLVVSDQVVAYAAEALDAGRYEGGIPVAMGWIRSAADRLLNRFLESGATPGMMMVLAPDDLQLPDDDWTGFWR